MPGDSGVPPTFDFSGSENVGSVTVQWPAPEKFPDGAGGNSIGYLGDVILPLQVALKDATKEAFLHLKLSYDICANMCVPAEANLQIALSGSGAGETAIEEEEQRVPRRVALGAGKGLAILSVHREDGGEHGRIIVEVAAPENAPVDLFVEGPTPDWSLPVPELSARSGGTRRFTFDIDGLPPGAHIEGATLTFTAVERRRCDRGRNPSRLIGRHDRPGRIQIGSLGALRFRRGMIFCRTGFHFSGSCSSLGHRTRKRPI